MKTWFFLLGVIDVMLGYINLMVQNYFVGIVLMFCAFLFSLAIAKDEIDEIDDRED